MAITETWFKGEEGNELMKSKLSGQYLWIGKERKNQRGKRGSGGVGLIMSRKVGDPVLLQSSIEGVMWVQVKTGIDIILGVVYIPPAGAPEGKRFQDSLLELESELTKFSSLGEVILLGDFNCRIGNATSYILSKDAEEVESKLERASEDCEVPSYAKARGNLLAATMNACRVIILNGLDGKCPFTCHNSNNQGSSVIDYICLSTSLFPLFIKGTFRVHDDYDIAKLSDHRLVSCSLKIPNKYGTSYQPSQRTEKWRNWRPEMKEKLDQEAKMFDEFLRTKEENPSENVETLWKDWTDKIMELQTKVVGKKRFCQSRRKARWDPLIHNQNKECKKYYITWKNCEEGEEKIKFFEYFKTSKRVLKRLVRQSKLRNQKEKLERLEAIKGDCPRLYWNSLRHFRNQTQSAIPSSIAMQDGTVLEGKDALKVWEDTFKFLGCFDPDDARFDRKFVDKTELELKTLEESKEIGPSVLEKAISHDEVKVALNALRCGKAQGLDGIMAEILKFGGEPVSLALWLLIKRIFEEETIPLDWSKGIIFPIFKGKTEAERRDPRKYRGITLLSIVSKVYISILNSRLSKWCETEGKLSDTQAGFRTKRSTIDQAFILTEILQRRFPKPTFCAFLDIENAYDRVFRQALMVELWKKGIRGKFWRILHNIYEHTWSCVRVGESYSDWFETFVGLRQGCNLSPVLYLIFINELVRALEECGVGVQIALDLVCALLFADDLVLLAEDSQDLQKLLDVASNYARNWRFVFNSKKSHVFVFGPSQSLTSPLRLGEVVLDERKETRYMGLDLVPDLSWTMHKAGIVTRARAAMSRLWALGLKNGTFPVRTSVTLWSSLVRSILEYGSEIWGGGSFVEAEKLQLEIGRRILRCSGKTSNDFVLGELGFWRLKARRDFARLRFWGFLTTLDSSRLLKRIYLARKIDDEEGKPSEWCRYTRNLLKQLGLYEYWRTQSLSGSLEQWKEKLRRVIHSREEKLWRKRILKKPKLRLYRTFKFKLRLEDYLITNPVPLLGRCIFTSLRSGTNQLRIETGRHCGEEEKDRLCQMCTLGKIENEVHFLTECPSYEERRVDMFKKIHFVTKGRINLLPELDNNYTTNILIGEGYNVRDVAREEIQKIVMGFLLRAMNKRSRRLGTRLI